MELEKIKEMAIIENVDLKQKYINTINEKLKMNSLFYITIELYMVSVIEEYCDNKGIPFYYVTEGCCIIGRTYAELYEHIDKL